MSFQASFEKLASRQALTETEAFERMKDILHGKAPAAQVAGFLSALRTKGETADEVSGFVRAMQATMVPVHAKHTYVADTCGTGGDGHGTFNISTASAFVAAAAGQPVAKHGNRSVSSRSGSADVMEALGVKIDMAQPVAEKCLDELGITFLFAPLYHPAMKNVALVRKELGIRTVFNILGPLANPARANLQVIGVAKASLVPLVAEVLHHLNRGKTYSAMVLNNAGHDEWVLSGQCAVKKVTGETHLDYELELASFGLAEISAEALCGGDARANAEMMRAVLQGKNRELGEIVVANAALVLYCRELISRASSADLRKGVVERARESLRSGAALKKLDQLIEASRS